MSYVLSVEYYPEGLPLNLKIFEFLLFNYRVTCSV
jgi:hypothetical protein